MRNRKAWVLWIVLVGLAGMARAQDGAAGSAQREQVKKLDFLVGEWKGEGWSQIAQGPRETFQATETVQAKLDGMILVFEGLGKDSSGKVGHNAYAVLSWDQATQRYRFLAFRADGIVVDTAPVMGDKTMQWGFEIPQGKLRFTLDFSKPGEWFETGEWSRDGQQWVKFMEMRLKKV
jgi:hypothetical protein